jgi:hypothetical protein
VVAAVAVAAVAAVTAVAAVAAVAAEPIKGDKIWELQVLFRGNLFNRSIG